MTPVRASGRLTDPERRALEAEREFLLRSLGDLDEERAADGIDDDTYGVLHADYTARAAAVVRRLAGQRADVAPNAARPPGPRRFVTVLVLAVIALAITLVVIVTVAPRQPGESLTGNEQQAPTEFERLRDAGLRFFQAGDYVEASKQLAQAVQLDPDDVEAQAFYGWAVWQLVQLAPAGDDQDELLGIALEHLEIAIGLDPEHASANTFYGIVRFRGLGDAAGAIPYLEQAVAAAGEQAPPVLESALAEARATVAGSTTTTGA
jgi:tetratricopeptide (TPR) repeat protein